MSTIVTRSLAALAIGGFASLAMINPAHADTCPAGTYPPMVNCTPFTLTVTAVVDGKPITVTVTGFKPFSTVELVLHSVAFNLGSFTADSAGTVTASVMVPAGFTPGAHTVTASGIATDGSPRIMSAPVSVLVAPATGTGTGTTPGGIGGLPFTGFEVGSAALVGAGLLGAGGIAIYSGRKRKAGLAVA